MLLSAQRRNNAAGLCAWNYNSSVPIEYWAESPDKQKHTNIGPSAALYSSKLLYKAGVDRARVCTC